MTSHSSQGQTTDRVLVHVDTEKSELLVNDRFAYVSVSRGQYDAQIYTNDRSKLARELSRDLERPTATQAEEHSQVGQRAVSKLAHKGAPENERGREHRIGLGLA